nr:reverse transcriptase domain-containing protein [Tanacetum cinerariifolium]
MSTRSSARNLFPPLHNPELTIRRRSRANPTLLNDFKMSTEGNGDPPVPDLWTIEELCQPSLNGRGGTFMKRRPEECYDLIENMTVQHNDWDTSAQRTVKLVVVLILTMIVQPPLAKPRTYMLWEPIKVLNTASSLCSRTLSSNTITNLKEDLKGITTRSEITYQGPTIPTTSSSLPQVVECETETETLIPNSEPVVAPVIEPVVAPIRKFHFPVDFVVVDFNADPLVPLILGRSFLKIRKALIDVYKGELTLRVGKEAITFNLDQTSRYSANYNDMMANRIEVIDMAYEEYSQELLDFSDVVASGNPTPYYDPIVSTSSPTLTPFGDSDFLLEEVDAFLALEDDPTSPKVDHSYYDTEGDILLLKAFVNDDPSLPPPTQGKYLPQVQKELKICEAKNDKSSIDEPPEV